MSTTRTTAETTITKGKDTRVFPLIMERSSMVRPVVVLDGLPVQTLLPLSVTCRLCDRSAHIAYYTHRTVMTLNGCDLPLSLTNLDKIWFSALL